MDNVVIQMTGILGTMGSILVGLASIQTPLKEGSSTFLPDKENQPYKYAYEMFNVYYTAVWILLFGSIVVFQLYEQFDANAYLAVCVCLAAPLMLQPVLFPSAGFNSPDQNLPLFQRFSFKANLWIAIYSFTANYWLTHYFYSVLQAKFTFDAHRLNNVPICLYFATHFYFSTYHLFSNMILRKVTTSFEPNGLRLALFCGVILAFSYFTAFMETLTISSFPYYSFEDREMAYKVGSAFYGIYFLVSYPAFFFFDEDNKMTLWETTVSSCGISMMIFCVLDFVRQFLDIALVIG